MNDSRYPAERAGSGVRSNVGTYLALAGLLVMAAGLLALMAFVNIAFFGVLIVIVAFFGMGLFHYVVWGWWLSSLPSDDDEVMPPL